MDLANCTLRELTSGFNHVTDTTLVKTTGSNAASSIGNTLRRSRTREQGIALIMTGHAIEHLLYSRLGQQENTGYAEREALAILLTANLTVYREGVEVVPLSCRLRQWFHGGKIM